MIFKNQKYDVLCFQENMNATNILLVKLNKT